MSRSVTALESSRTAPITSRRCAFHNRQGNQCRFILPADGPEFCASHARLHIKREREQSRALADELIQVSDDFGDPAEVHLLLARLFRMVAEKRISLRRALVLLQIGRHLNRTLRQLEDYVSIERPEYPAIKLSAWKWNLDSYGSVPGATTTSSPSGRREDPPANTSLDS